MVKQILKKIGLYTFVKKQICNLKLLKRKMERVDKHIIMDYCRKQTVKKLHIGCGDNILKDWLNSDLFPSSRDILLLDATKPLPFGSNIFDYVFSEHLIEHISYSQGLQMLKECYRILKRNGKIRISTPNLSFLLDLYKDNTSEFQKRYIKCATDTFIGNVPCSHATFVINNFMRAWGHTFIYDEKLLCTSLEQVGFTMIVKCDLKDSKDEILRNLENERRMPLDFLKLETMTLEGTKITDS